MDSTKSSATPSSDPEGPSPATLTFHLAGRPWRISRFTHQLIMGLVVGAVTGLVALLFRLAGVYGEHLFYPHDPTQMHLGSSASLRRLLMPGVGGLISGVALYLLGTSKGIQGIPAILQAVAAGQTRFRARMALAPALSLVTILTGGSVGPEGPIAEIGSVAGSQVGQWSRLPPKFVKTLIGSGVAAGIAAVFNAPIAGIFFAIEVILRNYEIASFTPIAVASVTASVIANAILGDMTAIRIPVFQIPMRELPLFALLGLCCGGVSYAYIHALSWAHERFARLPLRPWLMPAVGGLMVGAIGVFFPNIMGEGYDWIGQTLRLDPASATHPLQPAAWAGSAWFWVAMLLVIMVLKILATAITLGSGNPGGSFAPAVFVGVMGGTAFGMMAEQWIGVAAPPAYGAMGMAGLIAGALGAPVTAILIVLRQGGHASPLLLPLLTTVALSMFVMQRSRGITVYTLGFLRSGVNLDAARQDPLSLFQVHSVMHESGFDELPASMPVVTALARFRDSLARWFIVRGEAGAFVGIVSLHEMRLAIAELELANLLTLSDITDAFVPRLHAQMTLRAALAQFRATDAEVLPVFDQPGAQGRFIGVMSRQDALNAYGQYAESA